MKNSVIEIKGHLRIVFVDLLKHVPIFKQRLQLILNIVTSIPTDILTFKQKVRCKYWGKCDINFQNQHSTLCG